MECPKGFKGKVAICWHTRYEWLSSTLISYPNQTLDDAIEADDERVYLGCVDIDAKFETTDIVGKQINSLEQQIEKERAESQRRINVILGKIRDLQSLEHQS